MTRAFLASLLSLALLGCAKEDANTKPADEPSTEQTSNKTSATDPTPADATEKAVAAIDGDTVKLTGDNMRIEFVGAHVGEKPDPRKGQFADIDGLAQLDNGQLKSIELDIKTAALTTEIDKLTDHLKSPDFFDVRQHPTATFKSTSIETAADGSTTITGDLTLHGVTKSVTLPAKISTGNGLQLESQFTIDRTEFGMDYGADKVEKDVAMTVKVGP